MNCTIAVSLQKCTNERLGYFIRICINLHTFDRSLSTRQYIFITKEKQIILISAGSRSEIINQSLKTYTRWVLLL